MGFLASFVISLIFMVVGELLRPKAKTDKLKPSGLSEFQFPTADPSRTIGVWWGRCKFKGPNTVWFGDLTTIKKTKKVKTGWFSSATQDLGFNYYLGVQLVYGWGGEDVVLIDITVGEDEKCLLDGADATDEGDYYSMTFNAPDILEGSKDFPNGIKGPAKFYKGTRTQTANLYLQSKFPEIETCGFRGVMFLALEHCYLGNSDTPPIFIVTAERTPNQLGMSGGMQNINNDANPACMLYEILIEKAYWGLSTNPDTIDTASFIACGETLFAEGMGLSMSQETPVQGKQLMGEILRHIDGIIFKHPDTGLWTMKIARADYVVEDLRVFNKTNIEPGSFEFGRISYADTRNVITVNYTDRLKGFNVLPVDDTNLANVFARNGTIDPEEIDFLGFSSDENARKACARALKTRSSPLARCEFQTNRTANLVTPCEVIVLEPPIFGLDARLIMRVLKVGRGTYDDQKITVTCTEDIFAIEAQSFSPGSGSGWTPLLQDADHLAAAKVVEVPYGMLRNEERHSMVLGVRSDGVTEGFQLWSATAASGTFRQTGTSEGTLASGLLVADFDIHDDPVVGFIIDTAIDPNFLQSVSYDDWKAGQNLLMIDNEIMAWRTVTDNLDGTWTISDLIPAIYDTVPRKHLAGARVFFFNASIALIDEIPYERDVSARVRLPTFAQSKVNLVADADDLAFATFSRALRPNPPGRIRFNGGVLGVDVTSPIATDVVVLTWQSRDKTVQGVQGQDDDLPVDPTVKAVLRLTDATTGDLLHEASGIDSPATFSFAVDTDVHMTLAAIDAQGDPSFYAQVFYFTCSASAAGDTFHVSYSGTPIPVGTLVEVGSAGGIIVLDCSQTDQFTILLTEDSTVEMINVPESKVITCDVYNTGDWTLAFPTSVMFATCAPYVATIGGTTVMPKKDKIGLMTLTAGLLWTLRADLDVNDDTDVQFDTTIMSVQLDTNPLWNFAFINPNMYAVANVIGGTAPYTYDWVRTAGGFGNWNGSTDNRGGADYVIDDATIYNPTFSRTGPAFGLTVQNWIVTVTDANGLVAKELLQIALSDDDFGTDNPFTEYKPIYFPPSSFEEI